MAEDSGTAAEKPNWLGKNRIPDDIKLIILDHISSPRDLACLRDAYPEWVDRLWNQYPNTLFPPALEYTFCHINAELRAEVLYVYHIRRIRKQYTTAMGSLVETQAHRNWLQADLRSILSIESESLPELEPKLQTILDVGEVIWDVKCLTHRYSNDAWGRIHDIAERTAAGYNTPEIKLTQIERLRFNRAFLRVDIYLLTKYWTNAQGQRYTLDMGQDIEHYIPHSQDLVLRQQFDSCLRYMFDSHRGYLKKMATQLGAPVLPARDDLQWVPNRSEAKDYLYKDHGTITPQGDPEIDFSRRSVSEEQRFLLWLCESGIKGVRRMHRDDDSWRRGELLLKFSRRHVWDTVELRHRVCRYDVRPEEWQTSLPRSHPHRNRHPVKSLYGSGPHQQYTDTSSPWACASAFLDWTRWMAGRWTRWMGGRCPMAMAGLESREGITLTRHHRWLTNCDMDMNNRDFIPFRRKHMGYDLSIPYGHQYMFDPEDYQLRVGRMPFGHELRGP